MSLGGHAGLRWHSAIIQEATMHPYIRQAIAQAHIDELNRVAARRRTVGRTEGPLRHPKLARRRPTLRPAFGGAHR
ncbi:MAG TPA: hypothetical protein VG388_09150 [Solirubrobacteraceae bacterium]|jgi:hypothetical protein|nr:hypothetical protein [Solirubrobacteraceae bacterium]